MREAIAPGVRKPGEGGGAGISSSIAICRFRGVPFVSTPENPDHRRTR